MQKTPALTGQTDCTGLQFIDFTRAGFFLGFGWYGFSTGVYLDD
jgi:hypothetical protein